MRFIAGIIGALTVREDAPRIVKHPERRPHAYWAGIGAAFHFKRNMLEDFRSPFTHDRCVARIFPEDAAEELTNLEAELKEAQRRVKKLMKERQDLLEALLPRADRIPVSACTVAAPPVRSITE